MVVNLHANAWVDLASRKHGGGQAGRAGGQTGTWERTHGGHSGTVPSHGDGGMERRRKEGAPFASGHAACMHMPLLLERSISKGHTGPIDATVWTDHMYT